MTPIHRRRISVALVAVVLPFTTIACGSDGEDSASTTTEASAQTSADDTEAVDSGGSDPSDTPEEEEGVDGDVGAPVWTCEEDSNMLSGSSTVLFSADVTSGATEADITDETTAVVSADGSGLEPSALRVEANTMFGIKMAEDGSLDGVIIGCASGQTVPPGVTVGFLITEPGTYPVSLDIAGHDIGTIVVE